MSTPPEATDQLINSNVVFVDQDMLVKEVVKLMIDSNISSVLVIDKEENVVGILTERDIVHKFTLLEVAGKLAKNVALLMTKQVKFVHLKSLKQDITTLHMKHKIRHFPVLNTNIPKKENVLGMISITDLARQYLLSPSASMATGHEGKQASLEIGVFSHKSFTASYVSILKVLGFDSNEVSDIHAFLRTPGSEKKALLFDLDGFTDKQQHDLIPLAMKSQIFLIITTSNPNLLTVFRKFLVKGRQEIIIKPLDMSYLSWVLSKKWAET